MIKNSEEIQQLLVQAHQLYDRQEYGEAKALYIQVLSFVPDDRDVLQSLVAICLQSEQTEEAEEYLGQLVAAYPAEANYCHHYANLLLRHGKTDAAIACYRQLLEQQPELADSHYNFARLLKHVGRNDEALDHYQKALDHGVAQPEEVYSNISVIYSDQHQDEEAQAALQLALSRNPHYTPALYNQALLQEERGRWEHARDLYLRILSQEPSHIDAMVRLAHVQSVKEQDSPIIGKLQHALADMDSDHLAREHLHFALGKVYDDCHCYAQAFEHYHQGNYFARERVSDYSRGRQEALTRELMKTFSPAKYAALEPVSDAAPIFICGMFRSGSTLLEQMLAAHPQLTPGGEINFFNQQAPLPVALASTNQRRLNELGTAYLDHLARTFPDSSQVTNKRPDNFLYLGFIRALFPNARIINTLRHPLDNCLSVFFQQLAAPLNYANDLLDIGHYYLQYRSLMDYWKQNFAGNIMDIVYDDLVREPRTVLEPLLAFLGLDWDERCLEFYAVDNRVRTASVWQVRQPLHRQSSGRRRHYAEQLEPLRNYLREANLDF